MRIRLCASWLSEMKLGLRELYESNEALDLGSPPQSVELLALVDRVVDFVHAGVEAAR